MEAAVGLVVQVHAASELGIEHGSYTQACHGAQVGQHGAENEAGLIALPASHGRVPEEVHGNRGSLARKRGTRPLPRS